MNLVYIVLYSGQNRRKPKVSRESVTSEVLPSIRYDHENEHKKTFQEEQQGYINLLKSYTELMEICGGMDDRDRLLVRDLSKNAILDNKHGLLEVKNDQEEAVEYISSFIRVFWGM